MEFTQGQRENLDKVASRINCPKDFICYKLEPEELCKKHYTGDEKYLVCIECSEEGPKDCEFAMLLEGVNLCRCPLRTYIAEHLM